MNKIVAFLDPVIRNKNGGELKIKSFSESLSCSFSCSLSWFCLKKQSFGNKKK